MEIASMLTYAYPNDLYGIVPSFMNILWLVGGEISPIQNKLDSAKHTHPSDHRRFTSAIASIRLRLLQYLPYFQKAGHQINIVMLNDGMAQDPAFIDIVNQAELAIFGKK